MSIFVEKVNIILTDMKKINTTLLILTLLLNISCEKKTPEFFLKIPIEDRFIFKMGDTLDYRCSNGSTFKVVIKNYNFNTQTKISQDWFDNTHIDHTDLQTIILETFSNDWNVAIKNTLGSDGMDFEPPCFIVNTLEGIWSSDENPGCWILNGCMIGGSAIIGESNVKFQEKTYNNRSYKKVYSDSKKNGKASFTIHWNLKYGIISFESSIDGSYFKWDLEVNNK